jgi:aryl-alcohol dehydrogenase-like predicted oxidoreductase
LKCSNKVDKIGFSLYYPSEIDYLLDNKIDFDIVQIPYSIFDQRFENYLHLLKEKNIEVHIRSVFLQGLFFKKPDELSAHFVKIREDLENINKISKCLNISIASLCIKFALINENIDKIIIGVDSIENLKENLRGIKGKKIKDKFYNLLKNMKVDDENIILPFSWS